MRFAVKLVPSQFLQTTSDYAVTAFCNIFSTSIFTNHDRVVKGTVNKTSRRIRWAGHVARMGEERGLCRVLVGKPEGKRPLGRPRRRWVDNIRMDLQEVG